MDDGQSISRKRKVDNDFISDLPLSIIHCILALVPIRDAVKTCILARQWRYKWASLPRLVFTDTCRDSKGIPTYRYVWKYLKNFITHALLQHEGPIHKFHLSVSFEDIRPDIDHWLLCLSRTEIKELSLQLRALVRINSSLYSCRKLTHLALSHCELPPLPPTFKGFSCLRSIDLRHVKAPFDTVDSLVSDYLLLESFTIRYSQTSEFRINAPRLKYFHLKGNFKEISLYAPVLAEVYVSLPHFIVEQEQEQLQLKSSVCNYTKFLGGVTNVERFSAICSFPKYLSIGIESYDRSLVFHQLKFIYLTQVNFQDIKEVLVIVHLIMGAPNLHTLQISINPVIREDASEAPLMSFSDFGYAPNFTFEKLRVVEIGQVRGLPYEMEFVSVLLKSSPMLETMHIHYYDELPPEVIVYLTTKLLRYRRVSPNAEIVLIGDNLPSYL